MYIILNYIFDCGLNWDIYIIDFIHEILSKRKLWTQERIIIPIINIKHWHGIITSYDRRNRLSNWAENYQELGMHRDRYVTPSQEGF